MNTLRFRSGQVHLRRLRVAADTVIHPGDVVCVSGSNIIPAAQVSPATEVSATLAGVAHGDSPAGKSRAISVDVSPLAVYEVEVVPGTFEVGDWLTLDAGSSTRFVPTTNTAEAVARAAEFSEESTDRLRVTFASAVVTAAGNAASLVGA